MAEGQKSWVIWLKDGRYAYAWGETAAMAKFNWLQGFSEGVKEVVLAGEYGSQLPPERRLWGPNGEV